MKFNFSEVVEVPASYLFQQVGDFTRAEQAAQRRGIRVQRTDSGQAAAGAGTSWDVVVRIRRRPRDLKLDVLAYDPPDGFTLQITSQVFVSEVRIDCVALSRSRSRLLVVNETRPLNLRGRLLIQSLKLARGRIKARGEKALADYAHRVELDYAAS